MPCPIERRIEAHRSSAGREACAARTNMHPNCSRAHARAQPRLDARTRTPGASLNEKPIAFDATCRYGALSGDSEHPCSKQVTALGQT
jgi:hypothetical protein